MNRFVWVVVEIDWEDMKDEILRVYDNEKAAEEYATTMRTETSTYPWVARIEVKKFKLES